MSKSNDTRVGKDVCHRNSHMLTVRVFIDINTLENTLLLSYNVEDTHILQSSIAAFFKFVTCS